MGLRQKSQKVGRGRTEDILQIQRDGKERGEIRQGWGKETENEKEQKKEKERKMKCVMVSSVLCDFGDKDELSL